MEDEILKISKNESLEVKSNFPMFPNIVFRKSINYSPWIQIKKNYANFNLNNIFYDGKEYAGFRIDTSRSIDQRLNSAYIIFDTEKGLIYKTLDVNGNYEEFSDNKRYSLTQSSVDLILMELIKYLSN